MDELNRFAECVFNTYEQSFSEKALELFRLQYKYNPVYREFVDLLQINPENIQFENIPFLPVECFKNREIICGDCIPELIFESSGTSGMEKSRHLVCDTGHYINSLNSGFELLIGKPSDYCFLCLLPSYLESTRSSLVWMCRELMKSSGHPRNGFYLYEYEKLAEVIRELEIKGQPTILIGVTYALLDFCELFPIPLDHTIMLETGGMKGRRKEMVREEIHQFLKNGFQLQNIGSEYGMTELLSQAYSRGDGIFKTPPWMKIITTEINDPFKMCRPGETGRINVIDLANVWSCAFIATSDIGRVDKDGSFEVLGRIDNSDIRGCNLLVS